MHITFSTLTKRNLGCALLGTAITLSAGCSEKPAEPVSNDSVEVIKPVADPAVELPSSDEPVELIEPEPQPNPESEQSAYTPPYPNRTNLFEPLHRANRLVSANNGDNAESVVLMGFANLGTPKVVLAIDGVVTPLADGDEQRGVKVISIAPPLAVLQRGRSRWTATLE